MKLELKHLAPYLPYGLKFYNIRREATRYIVGLIEDEIQAKDEDYEIDAWCYEESDEIPILFPLSDLNKEIEFNDYKINVFREIHIYEKSGLDYLVEQIKLGLVEVIIYNMLIEYKFDVFGLIEQGLAVPVTKDFNPYK